MLATIADLAVKLALGLLPDLIEQVRAGKDEAAIRKAMAIKLRRRAIEAAYDAVAKEAGKL